MARKTLLSYVQSVLSELNSDGVNSINDTLEAQQVANIVQDAFFDIVYSSDNWTFKYDYYELIGLGDLTAPTKFKIPENVSHIDYFKYRVNRSTDPILWNPMTYLEPADFMNLVDARDNSDDNVIVTYLDSGVPIYCFNNQQPNYWTSFDDQYIYLDSYQADVEDTVQGSRTKIQVVKDIPFIIRDDFIPDIPYNMEALLLNESKVRAFVNLKGQANPNAQKYANLHMLRLKKNAVKTKPINQFVNWGR